MACEYREDCYCASCSAYRRLYDYRPQCDCKDCTIVRAVTCPDNDGRVGSCPLADAAGAKRKACRCAGSCGCK